MIRARSTSHRIDSSWAFFIIPLRRFEKVTCRLFLFSIRFSWNFPLPISLSDGETNFVGCGRYVGDSGFFLREGAELHRHRALKAGVAYPGVYSHWTAACFMKRCVLGPTGCPAAKVTSARCFWVAILTFRRVLVNWRNRVVDIFLN